MEKSQRFLGKATKRGNRNRNRSKMSVNEDREQLIDAAEIKQEPDIKDEPQPIVGLATVPAQSLDNRGDAQALIDDMESDEDKEELVSSPFDGDVKIEVKNECDEKEKKEKELNDADEGEANSQSDKHPSNVNANNPRPNEIGNGAHAEEVALKQHQCTQCEYTTKYKGDLNRHLLKQTGEKPFACKHCSKAFASNQSLQNHMKVHVKDFLFNCSVCLRGFDRKNEKMEHEGNCKALRYECYVCKKSFRTRKDHLIAHMRVHSGERAFECQECFKQFTQKYYLNRHIKLHAGPRPFRCSKCFQAFSQQNERNEHESKCNRHTFECYACGKAFGLKKVNLDQHMRIHTGDKPFECNQCSKKFTRRGDLQVHMKLHSRSLRWKCFICRKGFSKSTQCNLHQRNCRQRVYECCLCKKFIGSKNSDLKRHMTKHSGAKPFRCEICRNRFGWKISLTKHLKNIHNN